LSYRLKSEESVPDALKRVACEEIDSAVGQLTGMGAADRDVAIHEARKSVKKVRGVLRLARPELGRIYGAENMRLRDVGRKLSAFRDASAIIETFDQLREKYRGQPGGLTFAAVRRGLAARKREAERRAPIDQVLTGISADLREIAKQVTEWPLETDGFAAIEPGLEGTFRRGRKALARARQSGRPEDYHEWRKRVKDHWYHVRLLERLWTDGMQSYEESLKHLETCLGEEHNVVVLREVVLAQPASFGGQKQVAAFVRLLGRYQKELRDQALDQGKGIYSQKPRRFGRRIKQLWNAWKEPPKAA
jgi:CHAD domain-containing protein